MVASFPALHRFSKKWVRSRNIHHMNDVRWMQGGHKVGIGKEGVFIRVLDFIIKDSATREDLRCSQGREYSA